MPKEYLAKYYFWYSEDLGGCGKVPRINSEEYKFSANNYSEAKLIAEGHIPSLKEKLNKYFKDISGLELKALTEIKERK